MRVQGKECAKHYQGTKFASFVPNLENLTFIIRYFAKSMLLLHRISYLIDSSDLKGVVASLVLFSHDIFDIKATPSFLNMLF